MCDNNRYLYQGKACLKKLSNVTEACECFTSSSFNTTSQAVRGCDASEFSASIKAQLKKCKAAFSTCRKYEDDAVNALSACSKTQQQHSQKVKQRDILQQMLQLSSQQKIVLIRSYDIAFNINFNNILN